MHTFLTGSQVYGTPTKDSDVDLAVYMPSPDFETLQTKCSMSLMSTGVDGKDYPDTTRCYRFGKLNLLAFKDPVEFEAWKRATASLIEQRPVTREQAAATIDVYVAAAQAAEPCEALGGGK